MPIYSDTRITPSTQVYYGESIGDLELMPTTTKEGEGKYKGGLAAKGSLARILTPNGLKIYMLRSTGWVDVTDNQVLELLI